MPVILNPASDIVLRSPEGYDFLPVKLAEMMYKTGSVTRTTDKMMGEREKKMRGI